MKNNKILIYAAVLVGLVVIAYFLTKSDGRKDSTDKLKSEQFFKIDSASVDRLEFEKNGQKLTIAKVNGLWKIIEPVEYPVNQNFIASALSDLKNHYLESIISTNPNKKENFGFGDTTFTKLTVYQNGQLSGSFLIGSPTSAPAQTYLKRVDSDTVYLAEKFLHNNFVKPSFLDWRDLLIFSVPSTSIKSLEYNFGDEQFTVRQDSIGNFYIGDVKADSNVASSVFTMFNALNTQTFLDSTLAPDSKFHATLRVNWDKTTDFNFLASGDSTNTQYILQVSGNKQLFKFDQNLGNMILKRKSEFLGSKK